LIRICCFAFSVSPTPFIRQMNRATAESHHDQAIQEGLEPDLKYVAGLINYLMVKKFGYKDLMLKWEEDEAVDPLEQAQLYDIYVKNKTYHPDEIRQKLGEDPMSPKMRLQLDEPDYSSASNATVPDPAQGAAPVEEGGDSAKLKKSHGKKLNRLTRKGRLY